MWDAGLGNIGMVEGEFGVGLPITFSGITFNTYDHLALRIFKEKDTSIVVKDYSPVSNGTINLELTAAESALLPPGSYHYEVDWYQNGALLYTLLRNKHFFVIEKRGGAG